MSQYSKYSAGGGGGSGFWKDAVANAAALPVSGNTTGDARAAKDTGVIYVWTGASWDTAVAGVGTVTSVGMSVPSILSVSGSPVTGAGTLAVTLADQAANTVLAGPTTGAATTPTFRAIVDADLPTGTFNSIAGYSGTGVLGPVSSLSIDTTSGGLNQSLTESPNGITGGFTVQNVAVDFTPLQNSPNENWTIKNTNVQLDVGSTGFTQGTAGEAVTLDSRAITHLGTGNVGAISLNKNYFNIGNGTDPITVGGLAYAYGFGDINAGATISGQVQGHGFQPFFHVGSFLTNSVSAFYDFSNVQTASDGHVSYGAGPNILSMKNNRNYQGLQLTPTIATMTGNAGFTGVGVFPNLGNINASGNFQGLAVGPNITLNSGYAVGLNVEMANVTNYAGVASSLVVQDITYTFIQNGDNNAYTIEYVNDVLAGAEYFSILGQAVTGHIESGVSTATQVHAAALAVPALISAITPVITGTASNTQVTQAATNFTGGIAPGSKKAAYFGGDVEIQGALSFTGGLSIGALTSFATVAVPNGAGVYSIDTLITQPTVAASATISGTDLLAVNTAMLLNIGNNATVTSSFLGYAALGLPAVLSMGTGSTIDRVSGATFAISLDASATGGTAAEVDLCRAVAIPNGVTTVTELKGYAFDLPFGDPGTTSWGFYESPGVHNFFAGDLKIGTGGDTPTAGYKLHVEGGGLLVDDGGLVIDASSSGLGFFGATVVAQQASSGPQTATLTYTVTEQTMIQEMYNALRAYGLLT